MAESARQTVFLNGHYMPMTEATISPMDRGYLFGDGVYEVIPVYERTVFEWEAHLERLKNSLRAVSICNPYEDNAWLEIIEHLIEQHEWDNQFIYLQVTRGVEMKRDHLPQEETQPSVFVYTNPLAAYNIDEKKKGIKAITIEDMRWGRCDVKAITLLPNVMMKLAAKTAHVDDAILVRPNGIVSEGTASNLYMVSHGTIFTPPLSHEILPGITRQVIVRLAKDLNIPLIERDIKATELSHADEMWLSSSTKEMVPIIELNHHKVGSGKAGEIWTQLSKKYQEYKQLMIADYHSKH